MAHSRRSRPHEFGSSRELESTEKQILKYLHDHYTSPSGTVQAIKIAHGIGKKTKKEINKYLYNLQKKGMIEKVTDVPPVWRLQKYEPTMHMHSPPNTAAFGSSATTLPVIPTSTRPVMPSKTVSAQQTPDQFVANSFGASDFASTSRIKTFQVAATQPKAPSGDPVRENRVPPSAGEPSSDEFVIPPTPRDLMNDVTSKFHNFSFKDETSSKEDLENKVLQIINNTDQIVTEDIVEKISGYEIHAINEALRSLLSKNSIQKIGQFYSLPPSSGGGTYSTTPKVIFEGGDDFSMNDYDYTADIFDSSSFVMSAPRSITTSMPQKVSPQAINIPEGKNAISVVNEYAQTKQWKINYKENMSGPDHKRRFWMMIEVGGQRFYGPEAQTKKDAKLKAAETALIALYNTNSIQIPDARGGPTYTVGAQKEATLHDQVALLVTQKYNELAQKLPDTITGRKIIAGFVMSRKFKSGEEMMHVVSIGSGNRCVMGDKLSLQGQTVNDCHAEVIARRGLVRYFYRELLKAQDDDSKFILNEDKFALIPGIKFHLYISTAPCGDAAIFAPSDVNTDQQDQNDNDGEHHPLFENKKQGVLRTKIENGEGCIPIEEDTAAPTWDGVLRGERLRTMSCSDKIAKWNFLGLQGSLLSHFFHPIYMSTLTLGMLYNHGHLTRAICCRLQKSMDSLDKDLIPPTNYKVHHPVVSGQNQNRETGKMKTREFSLNWSLGDVKPEVLDGTEGKCEHQFGSVNPPRLCKAEIFKEFKKVCDHKNLATLYKDGYYKCKEASADYSNAKRILWDAFEKNGFGKWMPKPKEEKDF